jgi:putative ABC transport system permease protein
MMEGVIKDIKFAGRTLLKQPTFTAIAIVTLALGICASTTIFSIVDAVVLKPLPFHQSQKLVQVWQVSSGRPMTEGNSSAASFLQMQRHNQVFDSMAAYVGWAFNITGTGAAEHVDGAKVAATFFDVLGVKAELGRTFMPGEDTPGNNREVLLSHSLWVEKFASSRDVIGARLSIDGESSTVTGVMPAGLEFPEHNTKIWVPAVIDPQKPDNEYGIFATIARLKAGINLDQAQAQTRIMADELEREDPKLNGGRSITLVPLQEQLVGDVRPAMLLLLFAVLFVLLIACANIANLQLARGATRGKEMAIRSALGAGRGRIARQLLTESLVLSAAGGAIAILASLWTVSAIRAFMPEGIPRASQISLNGRVLLFAVLATVVTGALFGLFPGLHASKVDVSAALKQESRGAGAGRSRRRLLSLIIAFEIAISVVLSIGAGLMIRSYQKLLAIDPGFDQATVVTAETWLGEAKYPDAAKQSEFARSVVERLAAMKGVRQVGASMLSPFGGANAHTTIRPEGSETLPEGQLPHVAVDIVSPGYFEAMGIPVLSGRTFTPADAEHSERVVVISRILAESVWPGADAVGKRIVLGNQPTDPVLNVIGVVGNVRQVSLKSEPASEIYCPYAQGFFSFPVMTIAVRTVGGTRSLIPAITAAVAEVDSDQPLFDIKTMSERVDQSNAADRFQLLLLVIFSGLSLLLAAVGLYGVIDHSISQRTREIGVRMALGAGRRNVLLMVLGQTSRIILIGVAVGLAAAFGLTRLMASLLFKVTTTDVFTFAAVPLVLLVVALAASYVPTRRAVKVDPMIALRYE